MSGNSELRPIAFIEEVLSLMDRQILEMAEKAGIVHRDGMEVYHRTCAFKDALDDEQARPPLPMPA